MRLVEYLIQLLEAHAQTLQRLAAFFGEERLIELLEEEPHPEPRVPTRISASWFDGILPGRSSSPYTELEGAVREFNLPAVLEFHLWAYPPYRDFIESPLDLNSRIQGPGGEAAGVMVEEAVAQARAWMRRLPIRPEVASQAEQAAYIPWLRFRTQVLKQIGKRPLGPVY